MNQNRNYIAAIIFCSLLLMPLVFIVVFEVRIRQIQHSFLERLERESLQTVTIDESKLVWHKANKEVSFNGEMFDVKSYRLENGKYILLGLFDKKETALKNMISNQGKNLNDVVIQLLLMAQAFAAFVLYLQPRVFLAALRKRISPYCNKIFHCFIQIHTPPPRPFCLQF